MCISAQAGVPSSADRQQMMTLVTRLAKELVQLGEQQNTDPHLGASCVAGSFFCICFSGCPKKHTPICIVSGSVPTWFNRVMVRAIESIGLGVGSGPF